MRKPPRPTKSIDEIQAEIPSPNWWRVQSLFADVAVEDGLDTAEKIFIAVALDARRFVQRQRGRPKGRTAHDDFFYRQFATAVKVGNPNATARQVALKYLKALKFVEAIKPNTKLTDKMIRAIAVRFARAAERERATIADLMKAHEEKFDRQK
jgi:hypothetical protein